MEKVKALSHLRGFQWDSANSDKNWIRHKVSRTECEEVFTNSPLLISEDSKHSHSEPRNKALGKTNAERKLFIAFTERQELLRVISARDMSKREREIYEKA